jgi:oligoendopeptidase F
MVPGYRLGWSYIPHFIHTRFYCYSYVFGQLLVLALYRMYKEQGAAFVPRYLELLEGGGSDAPERLLKPLGVDFRDRSFWQKGFDEIRTLVDRVKVLADHR